MKKRIWETTPNRYGFVLSDDGEHEITIMISGHQGGGQVFGIVVAGVDGGMEIGKGEVHGYEREIVTDAINKKLNTMLKRMGWPGNRFQDAVKDGVKAIVPL